MKLDIPYYIRQVLREQRKVHVPGIGTFRIDQTSAHFSDDKTIISPPSLNVLFDETESEDDSLLKYILDAGLLTESKARKKIEQYTQSAFNKLLNVDSFLIEGVGKLVKNVGQDKVGFEPKITDLTKEFSDLAPMNLTPISRIQEQIPSASIADVNLKAEESGSLLPRILLILLLALLFISLYFIGAYLYNSYSNQAEEEKTEVPIVNEVEDVATMSDSSEKELELRYEEIDELIDPVKGEKSLIDDSQEPVESNSIAETKSENQEAGVINEVGTKDENEVPKTKIDEPIEEPEAKTIEPIEEANNTTANKYADIIPESGECIIVVGSFIKSLNAIKMASLLERKGYKVFRSEYKGFTRIGLRYECGDEDLEAYIQNIRKKISKRAWYLDPDLDVPYAK